MCLSVSHLSDTILTPCIILQAKFVNISLLLLVELLSEQRFRTPLVSVVYCVSFCVQSSWVVGENLLGFVALVGSFDLRSHSAIVRVGWCCLLGRLEGISGRRVVYEC